MWAQCLFKCFVLGGISPNFDLKKMISTYTKNFPWKKNMAQIREILGKKNPNRQMFMISSRRQPRIQKDSGSFSLSYLVCSQIWLNHLMDDHTTSKPWSLCVRVTTQDEGLPKLAPLRPGGIKGCIFGIALLQGRYPM